MLSKDDRIAFSLQIVASDGKIKSLQQAKAQVSSELTKLTKLDVANKNLFTPVNVLVNFYQTEYNNIDGNVRTTITETSIQNSAKRILRNNFFPNDTTVTVPSLSGSFNVWTKAQPFALTYAIGKNYTEGYGSTDAESAFLTTALGYITSAGANTDIQNTTGQQCTGTPPNTITTFPAVQTLKTNLVSTINTLVTILNAEAAAIAAIVDSNATRTAQNATALNNINNVILPALNLWLGYVDFNTAHGQTTCAGFNAYNSNLLAPTKLHSTQLTALQTALTNRQTFLSTRISQLNTNLGSISQDVNTGEITASSGLYGQRYSFLALRLDAFGGSLTQLVGLQTTVGAQDSIISNTKNTKATYQSILPTSLLKAPGNGTAMISVVDPSFLSPGDTVYVAADGQEELQRAVKSVVNDLVTLNDTIPAKYRPADKARIYKDIT